MHDTTDNMPLDGEHELTVEERKAIRRLIRDQERASWLWALIRTYFPWVTTALGVIASAAYWFITEIVVKKGDGP